MSLEPMRNTFSFNSHTPTSIHVNFSDSYLAKAMSFLPDRQLNLLLKAGIP
jgi:hypothetical protein